MLREVARLSPVAAKEIHVASLKWRKSRISRRTGLPARPSFLDGARASLAGAEIPSFRMSRMFEEDKIGSPVARNSDTYFAARMNTLEIKKRTIRFETYTMSLTIDYGHKGSTLDNSRRKLRTSSRISNSRSTGLATTFPIGPANPATTVAVSSTSLPFSVTEIVSSSVSA